MKQPSTGPVQKSKGLYTMGPWIFSLLVHGGLLLVIGGVVLIESVIPKQSFKESAAIDQVAAEPVEPEDEPLQPMDVSSTLDATMEAPATAASESSAPDLIATESNAPSQTFLVAPPVALGSTGSTTGNSGTGGTGKGPGPGVKTSLKMTSFFGSKDDSDAGLAGYLYDIKQTKSKRPTNITAEAYRAVIRDFAKTWDTAPLDDYYKTKKPLHIAQFLIPSMSAEEAPKAFGVQKEVQPRYWFAHYQGTVTAPESGTFRFLGYADDIVVVAVNKKIVLDGSLARVVDGTEPIDPWFEMKKGEKVAMDVIVGEQPGGIFHVYLAIQNKSEESALPRLVQFARSDFPDVSAVKVKLAPEPFVFE